MYKKANNTNTLIIIDFFFKNSSIINYTCLFLFFSFLNLNFCLGQPSDINPNGLNKFFHKNGKISSEGEMVNSQPEGLWKTYYETGILKSEGNWKNGKINDNWKFFSKTGVINKEITYIDGEKNGIYKSYDKDGNLAEQGFYKDNKKDSTVTLFYPNGNKKSLQQFSEGKQIGKTLNYNEEGILQGIQNYKNGYLVSDEKLNRLDDNGNKTGTWKEFHENGKLKTETKYKNGKPDGIVKTYTKSGKLKEIEKFEKGEIVKDAPELYFVDVYKTQFPDGSVKLLGGKKDGKKHGQFREYNLAGEVINGYIYKEDTLIAEGIITEEGLYKGKWEYYYTTGEIQAIGKYINGQKDSTWVYYYKNKKIEQKGNYKLGKPAGRWVWYYNTGITLRDEYFVNGKRDGEAIEYDTTGEIMTKGEYLDGAKEGSWYYKYNDYSEEGQYVDDLKEGVWKQFNVGGGQRFEGEFVGGEEKGKHIYYHLNGKIFEKRYYNLGVPIDEWEKYEPTGELIIAIKYKNGKEFKINGVKVKN